MAISVLSVHLHEIVVVIANGGDDYFNSREHFFFVVVVCFFLLVRHFIVVYEHFVYIIFNDIHIITYTHTHRHTYSYTISSNRMCLLFVCELWNPKKKKKIKKKNPIKTKMK